MGFLVPICTSAPTTSYREMPMIEENSLVSLSCPLNSPYLRVMGVLTGDWPKDDIEDLIRIRYPEMDDLLIYMVFDESTYCLNLLGDCKDNICLAYGCFQIHLDKHNISYKCAMDFLCSLDWTATQIKNGNGWWWTSYKKYYGKNSLSKM